MSVSPPGHWLLNRMVFLLNRTLGIINTTVFDSIKNLLKHANTFTGINTFMGGINVDNIDSINGNTTFNSEIIVNSNITANNGSFIGDNLLINNIEKNTNSNVTFQSNINMNTNDIDNINNLTSEILYTDNIGTIINPNVVFLNTIDMNYNNIYDVDTIFSNTLNINTISLENSVLPYITVQDVITFNNDVNINGHLIVDGSTITVNSETLTIDDRFIVLNANIESSGKTHTDTTGIIVNTHNSSVHSKGYLLWTLFDPNDPSNEELNRTWDLSGDNLRGNVLKATTLRGNILDSYYSPNISVISDIDMNNKDISNINTLTGNGLNIDVINTNTRANISVLTTIDMNNNLIINANIAALNNSQINLENGLINSRTLTLSNTDIYLTNDFNLGATHGMNIIGTTELNIWKGISDNSYTLFLPENNGQTNNNSARIIGGEPTTNTSSILAIGAFYKRQDSLQSLNNSQCYLIPPSMIPNDIPELKGNTLFETIGEANQRINYLAGYPTANVEINELRNTLVPTVGQIVDLLNYLSVSMDASKAHNLKSTY